MKSLQHYPKKRLRSKHPTMTAEQVDDLASTYVRSELKNSGRVKIGMFDAFSKHQIG
jgi:hypothetical protein